MDTLTTSLLIGLNEQNANQTAHDFLSRAAVILNEHLAANVTVCYELIPETGGVPKLPVICVGDLLNSTEAKNVLENTRYIGALNYLIRRWQPHYEEDARAWGARRQAASDQVDFVRFIETEGIKSFIFLPICHHHTKLAALFLCYRRHATMNERQRQVLEACRILIGTHLAQNIQLSSYVRSTKNRKAVAHTLYGGVAVVYKGQIDALEAEIAAALGHDIPPRLLSRLEMAKRTIFEGMRNLVIEASGDLLVDLETMPLSKAVNTAVSALRRAWPPGQAITIDVSRIPLAIERQPVKLRKLLYTLILEVVGNSIKHGGPAPYINIDLSWVDSQIYIRIIDHGQGFDQNSQPLSEHGLGFWQTYIVEQLTGEFKIASQPGYGTVISAEIPVIPVRVNENA